MLDFRKWIILQENIVINDMGQEAYLQIVSPNSIREFNYQDEINYSSFFIASYQARRVGYLHISDKQTHIGITKTSPIEQGKGTDIAFIKNLMVELNKHFKPIPYKEGESSWADIMKNIEGTEELQKGFKQSAEKDLQNSITPDIKKGSSNMQKVTQGISVSRASGSWSYFFKSYDNNYQLKNVLNIMESAIKPLVDHDIVEFYEIVDRSSGKREKIGYSKKGKEKQSAHENQYSNSIAYLKFLTENMLKNYPNAQKMVMDHIHQVGARVSGGGEHPAIKIQSANTRIPVENLIEFVNRTYAEDEVLLFFLKAIKKDSDYLYKIIDTVAKEKSPRVVLHYVDKLLEKKTEYIFDHMSVYLHDGLEILKNGEILKKLVPNEFNEFKNQYQDAVNEFISSGELDQRDIKYIKQLADYIDIDAIEQVNDLHKKVSEKEAEEKKKRQESIERRKFIIQEGSVKYVVIKEGDTVWKDIPDKYINYNGEIDQGEFCLEEIVDREDVMYDALEKASEDAYSNAEARPSESYGQEEAIDEISEYMDDFVNDKDIEIPEDMSDEDLEKLIKDEHLQDFINWRIEKLKEEEEEESWKYEPEPDEQDVYKYQEEFAVEVAFDERGLVILTTSDINDITIELNSKFEAQLTPILKRALEVSTREQNEFDEPIIKRSSKVHFSYRDRDKDKKVYVHDLL